MVLISDRSAEDTDHLSLGSMGIIASFSEVASEEERECENTIDVEVAL